MGRSSGHKAILPLDNEKFIASGAFTDSRFVFLNGEGKITESFGEYPSFMYNEKMLPNEGKFMFHQSFFLKNPVSSKIAVYTSHVLEIYEYGREGLTKQVQILLSPYKYNCETGTFLRANASGDTKRGVKFAQCDDKYIYLLFSHRAPEATEKRTEIWVFDWMGNPVKCLKPDKNIISFCIDSDQNTLYVIDDEAQLDRIQLDLFF